MTTTATAALPTPAPSDVDDNQVHLICCDDNTALCGEPLDGDFIDADDIPDEAMCRRCVYLRAELVPCGHPDCGSD